MHPARQLAARIGVIAGLDQPLRRDLFQWLAARPRAWTSRDDAAAALGVSRTLAAFHLDKLVAAGLVETRFERRTGRTGPGAGRPAKLYRRSDVEVSATVPDRHYDLAATILADAVAESATTGQPAAATVEPVARAVGVRLGSELESPDQPAPSVSAVMRALDTCGYEPAFIDERTIELANCPFHRLAERHRELVCGMNVALLSGLLDGLGTPDLHALLQPTPDRCCVRIVADPPPDDPA